MKVLKKGGRINMLERPKWKKWLVLAILFGLGTTGFSASSVFCIAACVACVWKLIKCRQDWNLAARLEAYAACIGTRSEVSLRELASFTSRSIEETRKDLTRLITLGCFEPDTRLDFKRDPDGILRFPVKRDTEWINSVMDLVRSLKNIWKDDKAVNAEEWENWVGADEPEEGYETRETADESYGPRMVGHSAPRRENPGKKVEEEPAAKEENPIRRTYTDQLEQTLSELYQLNVQIKDEKVSAKIDRIGVLVAGIFRAVIEDPNREKDVHKFMQYYLPTTLKMLKSYDLLENQVYQSENIVESRKKIENVLDQLISAYEELSDQLYSNRRVDIETDISVLETMLRQDGLSSVGRMKTAGGR